MKIFISVDIEGVTGVTSWSETELGHSDHRFFADQMTLETLAACEAALEMGAKEILVKDAHDSGRNMDISKLPKEVSVLRGWDSGPESMMVGLDESFDAVIFIGYHAGSGEDGNPLAHTMDSSKCSWMKINDEIASEFTLNTMIAAYYKVPVVFLSGDEMLCENSKKLVPEIETVAVKKGLGGATLNIHPDKALVLIKEGVKRALKDLEKYKIPQQDKPKLEIRFKDHKDARRAGYYPGANQVDPHTVVYEGQDIKDLIIARMFIL